MVQGVRGPKLLEVHISENKESLQRNHISKLAPLLRGGRRELPWKEFYKRLEGTLVEDVKDLLFRHSPISDRIPRVFKMGKYSRFRGGNV